MAVEQRPVLLLVGSSSEEPMPVLVKHSGLRMVAVNKDSVGLLDDTWDVLGVYFLFGHGSEPERYSAYVGEAGKRPLRTRLREHVRGKEGWNRALLITSDSSEGFDSAAIGWLEGRLHAVLMNATAAEVVNANTPADNSLPQYEREAMEGYIRPVMAAMRALGYPPDTPDQRVPAAPRRRPRRYTESVSDLITAGLLRVGTRLSPVPSAFDVTATVLADGRLQIGDRDFDAPSGAGAFVAGHATSGWDFWGVPSGEGGLKPLAVLREQLRGSESGTIAAGGAATSLLPVAVETVLPTFSSPNGLQREEITVRHLIEGGLLGESTVFAIYKGVRHEATCNDDGTLGFADGRTFSTLSAAARAVTGRPANGWALWKMERDGRAVALAQLREEILANEG